MKALPSIMAVFIISIFVLGLAAEAPAGPSGAKAIFDSGEGPSVRMSSGGTTAKPVTQTASAPKEKYVGVSYKLVLLRDNGSFDIVSKARTFRTGEKIKLLVRTNRPGYLTIMNIGTSGNSTVLCSEQVEPGAMIEIPRTGNFRFSGAPGTEKLLVMLSGQPNPMGGPSTSTVASAPLPPPPADTTSTAALPPPPPPASSDLANIPPPPPPAVMTASLEGSKDITLDNNSTSYSVVNPKKGWKPEARGKKDIILESAGGENFGVVPASYVQDGSILTLEIKLKHR